MPRLVHITTVPQSLGFVSGQVDFMASQGFDVHAISSPGELLDAFGRERHVTCHSIPMARAITPGADLVAVRRLTRLLRDLRPDIVHAHTPKGGLLGMMAATAAQVPSRIYHMRGLLTLTATGRRGKLLAAAETTSCHLAHRVICQSRSLREVAIGEGLVEPEKSLVLAAGSNGVDAEGRFDPERWREAGLELRDELGIPRDAIVVGFVGRLVGDKGINELAEAWRRLQKSQKEDTRLLVVGPYEERDPVPPSTREVLDRDPSVHMVGFTRETPKYYAAMNLLVLPTYREGFPNVPLEAAAMKLPVVATQVVGCVDAVQDGVTGVLVPARDAGALQMAIEGYLRSEGKRRLHGLAGRARVLREFRPEQVWEALLELYLEELALRGRS